MCDDNEQDEIGKKLNILFVVLIGGLLIVAILGTILIHYGVFTNPFLKIENEKVEKVLDGEREI